MAWLLIVLAAIDWGATVILARAAALVREPALEERATTSVLLSTGATLAAIMAAASLTGYALPDGFIFSLLAIALVILSVPQLLWAGAYWLGRFE